MVELQKKGGTIDYTLAPVKIIKLCSCVVASWDHILSFYMFIQKKFQKNTINQHFWEFIDCV